MFNFEKMEMKSDVDEIRRNLNKLSEKLTLKFSNVKE